MTNLILQLTTLRLYRISSCSNFNFRGYVLNPSNPQNTRNRNLGIHNCNPVSLLRASVTVGPHCPWSLGVNSSKTGYGWKTCQITLVNITNHKPNTQQELLLYVHSKPMMVMLVYESSKHPLSSCTDWGCILLTVPSIHQWTTATSTTERYHMPTCKPFHQLWLATGVVGYLSIGSIGVKFGKKQNMKHRQAKFHSPVDQPKPPFQG